MIKKEERNFIEGRASGKKDAENTLVYVEDRKEATVTVREKTLPRREGGG